MQDGAMAEEDTRIKDLENRVATLEAETPFDGMTYKEAVEYRFAHRNRVLKNAERRVREHMIGKFPDATIEGVVKAIRGELPG